MITLFASPTSKYPRTALIAFCSIILLLCQASRAGQKIYKWKDKRGIVHFTDNIEQVPEPWRSMYLRQEQEEARQRAGQPGHDNTPSTHRVAPANSRPPASPTPEYKGQTVEEARELYWRSEMRRWRNQLEAARKEYASLKVQHDNLVRRYKETFVLARRKEAEDIAKRMEEVRKRIDLAEKMLNDVLPKRAKKEGVPPGWLR